MTFQDYQNEVARTLNTEIPYNDQLLNFGGSLCEEVGEVFGVTKKMLYHGHPMVLSKLEDEMGDLFWYLFALADVVGIDAESFSMGQVDDYQELTMPVDKTAKFREELPSKMIEVFGLAHKVALRCSLFVHGERDEFVLMMGGYLNHLLFAAVELSTMLCLNMDEVLEGNIKKLRTRYPEGFSKEASLRRSV